MTLTRSAATACRCRRVLTGLVRCRTGRRRPGRRFLQGQDSLRADRRQCRRRVRPARAHDRPLHRPPCAGPTQFRAAEHDRRGRPHDGQPRRQRRAEGRHYDGDDDERLSFDAGARHRQRQLRQRQVQLDRLDHAGGRDDRGVAQVRRHLGRGSDEEGAGDRRGRARQHHQHLPTRDERAVRHQVQDRDRLSRRQRHQHRDGARRGRRPQQHVVELEGHARGMAGRQPAGDPGLRRAASRRTFPASPRSTSWRSPRTTAAC